MADEAINPLDLLIESYRQAHEHGDPGAKFCALTTLDETGYPVSRTVTVRDMHAGGIDIYINENSPKVEQLSANGRYELLFFWTSSIRQFRVRGRYEIFPSAEQESSWKNKPLAGKHYDLFQARVQAQSTPMLSRTEFRGKAAALIGQLADESALHMPDDQKCLRFVPDFIEFWLASMHDRLHDRQLCRLSEQGWVCQVLVP